MESTVYDLEAETKPQIYRAGLLAEDLSKLSPEQRTELNTQVRSELALQSRNKFLLLKGRIDAEPLILEERAMDKNPVWIQYSESDSVKVAALLGDELEERLTWLKSPNNIDQVISSASRFDGGRDMPEHMRALKKKFDHIDARKRRGDDCSSKFSRYSYPLIGVSNIARFNMIGSDLISSIINQADTVIDKIKSMELITPFGMGILLYKIIDPITGKTSLMFGGYIDVAVYSKAAAKVRN